MWSLSRWVWTQRMTGAYEYLLRLVNVHYKSLLSSFSKPKCCSLSPPPPPLLQIRLLNYFQRELPSFWLRYSERTVGEMVIATFSLLSLSYSSPTLLGPVHLIALLDPTADWLKKWMVSSYNYYFSGHKIDNTDLETIEQSPVS